MIILEQCLENKAYSGKGSLQNDFKMKVRHWFQLGYEVCWMLVTKTICHSLFQGSVDMAL